MKKQLGVVLFAALPLVAVGAFNQTWAATGQIDSASSTAVARSTQPSTTLVMRGTIQKYDPSSKVLTLSTPDGTIDHPHSRSLGDWPTLWIGWGMFGPAMNCIALVSAGALPSACSVARKAKPAKCSPEATLT